MKYFCKITALCFEMYSIFAIRFFGPFRYDMCELTSKHVT